MNRKRLLSLLMMVLFIFSMTSTVFAKEDTNIQNALALEEKNAKITKEDAIKISIKAFKNYFNIELDTKLYQNVCNFEDGYNERTRYVWHLNWNKFDEKNQMNFSTSIDADTGKILSISKNRYSNEVPKVPKYTREQSQKLVEEFIEKINPGALKNAKLTNDNFARYYYGYNPNYNFSYIRLVNGIEFTNNTINVMFNSIDGEVTSYSSSWDDELTFPSKEGTIGEEKAFEIFKNEVQFNLQYVPYRNQRYYDAAPSEIRLVYYPSFSNGIYVDGKTGKMLTAPYDNKEMKTKNLNEIERQGFLSKYKEIKKLDKEMDRVKAEEIANEIIKEAVGNEYKIENLSYQENNNYYETGGLPTWSVQFRKGVMGYDGGNMLLNAATGQLISLYKHEFYPRQEENIVPKITWEEAYSKAIDTVSQYFPNRVKDINTEQKFYNGTFMLNGKKVNSPEYSFLFTRRVNDIIYIGNSVSISIDTATGKVIRMSSSWDDDLKFPELKNIIQPEAAKEIYFESSKPVLSYITLGGNSETNEQNNKVDIVYMLKSDDYTYYMAGYIDAFTGKFVNFYGEDMQNVNDALSKNIKGNPYEKEITLLASYGIFDAKDFDVNKKATRFDVIKSIVNTRGYNPYLIRNAEELKFKNVEKGTEKYKYLQLAVFHGIIKNESIDLKFDENITREEMYKYIVDCTKYSKLAQAKGIFSLNYTDAKSISPDKYGYIALAKGLSIIDANIKAIKPKENITMAEFAHILYNGMQYVTNNN